MIPGVVPACKDGLETDVILVIVEKQHCDMYNYDED